MTYVFLEDTPRKIGEFGEWALLHLQAGDVPLRLASAEDTLRSNVLGNRPQGIQVTASAGVVSIWWQGPLWVAREQGALDAAYLEVLAMRGQTVITVGGAR